MTPFDLHALGTPPALILSQDQTLHQCVRVYGLSRATGRHRHPARARSALTWSGLVHSRSPGPAPPPPAPSGTVTARPPQRTASVCSVFRTQPLSHATCQGATGVPPDRARCRAPRKNSSRFLFACQGQPLAIARSGLPGRGLAFERREGSLIDFVPLVKGDAAVASRQFTPGRTRAQ